MKIDLRAIVLPEGCRVWRMFPGKSYGLLHDFLERKAAFLELPQLFLEENVEDDKHLYAKVRASIVLAELKRKAGEDAIPRVDWEDYKNINIDQTLGRITNSLINFFEHANKGDLIIVPEHKKNNVVRIGVFTHDPKDSIQIEGVRGYEPYTFPAREIDWFPPVSESYLSPALSQTLRHEHAFGDLSEDLYNEVFSLAYGNFIGNGVYSTVVANGNKNFTDSDNTLIGAIFTLAAYACEAQEKGHDKFEIEDIFDFLFNKPPIEFACLISSEHHSPGFTRYIGRKSTALVAAGTITALIAFAEQAKADGNNAYKENVTFTNSLDPKGGPCDPEIEEAQKILFRSIGGDKLRKACQNMLETKQRAELGLRSRPARRAKQ